MYHEITTKDKNRKRRNGIVVAAFACVLIAVLALVIHTARIGAREQGAVAMRKSIMDSAVRCCAIEGSYPMSLKHLEDHYGLRVNHHDYVITYEAFASNVAPSVVVVPR